MNLKMRVMKVIKGIITFDGPGRLNKIINLFEKTPQYILFHMLKYIPWTQEMCNEIVDIEPRFLEFVRDCFKTQEMCNEAVEVDPYTLRYVPVHLRTEEIMKKPLKIIQRP